MSGAADRSYLVPGGEARGELRDRGSRFLAFVAPAADAATALERVRAVERLHPDATHVCWAYRVGEAPAERSADAGEPAGTAGVPILQALRSAGLHDVVAAVVRWYGGVKLGKGGLARAYRDATRVALADLPTTRRHPATELAVRVGFARVGAVHRLVHPPAVELAGEAFDEAGATLRLRVQLGALAALRAALGDLGAEVVEPSPAEQKM